MEKAIILPSELNSLRDIEKIVDELSAAHNIETEIYGNVLIAALEAANNAIVHGNKLDITKNVEVKFLLSDNRLVISFKDMGPGFDYHNIPDPTAPENLEKINGRGVFLMEKLSDKIEFFDNGSKVELTFNLR